MPSVAGGSTIARSFILREQHGRATLRDAGRSLAGPAGDRVALLTSNGMYMWQAVATKLDLDDWGCNGLVVDNCRFTTETVEPLCVEEGHMTHAQILADEAGLGLDDWVFSTNSHSVLAGSRPSASPWWCIPTPGSPDKRPRESVESSTVACARSTDWRPRLPDILSSCETSSC